MLFGFPVVMCLAPHGQLSLRLARLLASSPCIVQVDSGSRPTERGLRDGFYDRAQQRVFAWASLGV
jgi:hypothetical protein